jgi:hypothetical protein
VIAMLRIVCEGLDMAIEFDPSSAEDCEVVAEAFLLMHRRYKQKGIIDDNPTLSTTADQ